ncbi:MAG: redoxin domain-containing protein [Candidatus Eisenbacteria bacterium]
MATHMSVEGQSQDIENHLLLAYGGPGRSRFEADTPSDRTVLVNAGDSTWTYSSTLAQYSVQPTGVNPAANGGVPSIDPAAAHPFAAYVRLAEHVAKARLVGRDTATVNGAVIPTFVIEVQYDSTFAPSTQGAKQEPKRLAIDATRFLVVRDESVVERVHPALPKPIRIEQKARFTRVDWNVQPDAALFAFATPAGAVRVERVGQGPDPGEEPSEYTGKAAAGFTLADLKGARRELASHRGKVVLLDFWATWCGPCRQEMPIVARLHEKYASKGLVVYGVNCSESGAKARAFVDKNGYRFPILLDQDGAVQNQYGVTAIPTVFIIDREGIVRAHMIGGRSEEDLVAALEKAGLETGP